MRYVLALAFDAPVFSACGYGPTATGPRVISFAGAEDSGYNSATMGEGRLVVEGGCLAFVSEATGEAFTLTVIDGQARFRNDAVGEWVDATGQVMSFDVGAEVILTGSEMTNPESVEFIDAPLVS